MYAKAANAAEAAAFGFSMEDLAEPPCEVWPDNLLAVNFFIAVSTQWRVGTSGAIGLDYTAIPPVMRLMGVKQADRAEVFECVRIMEDAALEQMRTDKKKG